MAVTVVGLYNDALSNMGTRSTVEAVDEGTAESVELTRIYERVRDDLLEAFDWGFARRTAELSAVEIAVASLTWSHTYQRPADCIRALYLTYPGSPPDRYEGMPELPFEASGAEDADDAPIQVIFTNESPAYLRYTKRMEDPESYPAGFRTCLGWALAAAAALNLTGSAATVQSCARSFIGVFNRATANNAREGTSRADDWQPEWLRARG